MVIGVEFGREKNILLIILQKRKIKRTRNKKSKETLAKQNTLKLEDSPLNILSFFLLGRKRKKIK
jgi:hypothetical protein